MSAGLILCPIGESEEAKEYLHSNLGGVRGLVAGLMNSLNSSPKLFALVPPEMSQSKPVKFSAGGVTTTQESRQWLLERLRFFSSQGSHSQGTLIAQDVWMRKNDWLQHVVNFQSNLFFCDEKPHFWLPCEALNPEGLTGVLNAPSSFVSLLAYSSFQLTVDIVAQGSDISEIVMSRLIDEVKEYYVSAYDGESFLVITKVE